MRLHWLYFWAVTVGFVSNACAGGGEADEDFLVVVQTDPAHDTAGVRVEIGLEALFDGELDPNTVTTQTFKLVALEGGEVQGSVGIGETAFVATFTPDEALELSTEYEATLTTAILDVDGRALEQDFRWRFRTLNPGWGDAEDLQNLTGDAQAPQVAVDQASNALAVWAEFDGTRTNIVASRFTRADLWGVSEAIEATDENATDFDLALHPEGDAIVVWRQSGEGRDSIWANRYTVDGGWGTPERIEADDTLAGDIATTPRVAIDSSGNAIALWYQTPLMGGGFNVWANRYVAGQGWGTAENIETEPPRFRLPHIDVGFDRSGNAIAIWTRRRSQLEAEDDLWANRYTAGQGWGTAVVIDARDTTVVDPVIAVTTDADAHAVWTQGDDDGVLSLWTNVDRAGAWGTAELFDEEDVNRAVTPQIATGPNGTLHAVWSQSDGTFANIWARMYTPAGRWDAPVLIEQPLEQDDADAERPRISVDLDGNVFVVWELDVRGLSDIWSNNLRAGEGWSDAELIQESATVPAVAAAPEGRAHAVWPARLAEGTVVQTRRFE
jgi:hypothetical protein